ncbi:MAG: asparaginase [Clostridiales bacterium]|nr:asparaginase [Candidatus Scatonaster coprocaballi]
MADSKKVLMVFTGGDISTRLSKKALELGVAPYALLDAAGNLGKDFTILEPVSVCSENFTPPMYKVLFDALKQELDKKIYGCVLIAHGTNTMAYTAQLAELLLSGYELPIVFFGSKISPTEPDSDAVANLKAAYALAMQIDKGIYVVGKHADGKIYVHYAAYMMSANRKTDDYASYKNRVAGRISGKKFVPSEDVPVPDECPNAMKNLRALSKLMTLPKEDTILTIDAPVCVNYANFSVARSDYKYVLQRLHYDGTVNTLSEENPFSILYLRNACARYDKQIFVAPIDSKLVPSASTEAILAAKIKPLYDMPFEAAWAYLMLSTWLGKLAKK